MCKEQSNHAHSISAESTNANQTFNNLLTLRAMCPILDTSPCLLPLGHLVSGFQDLPDQLRVRNKSERISSK